eukprot:m.104931 g.104931  ORF g.104931 m.104931 type:complete len:164 (+) comp18911_c0_seq3:336-827(+)
MKGRLSYICPPRLERVFYVFSSAATMHLILLLWEPVAVSLWQVENALLAKVLFCVQAASLMFSCTSLLCLDPLSLLGIKQAYHGPENCLNSKRLERLMSHCRHPVFSSAILAMTATSSMYADRAILVAFFAVYMFAFSSTDERDVRYVHQHLESKKNELKSFS